MFTNNSTTPTVDDILAAIEKMREIPKPPADVALLMRHEYDAGKASDFRWERRYLGGDARDITDWCEVVEPRYFKSTRELRYEQVTFTKPITPEMAKHINDIYEIREIGWLL